MIRSNRGVTLIELLVVVLVIAVLAAVALPNSNNWINRAQITDARGLLEQAIGRAKSNALRNPGATAGGTQTASAVCLQDNQVRVVRAQSPDEPASCTETGMESIWSADMPSRVGLTVDNSAFLCLCFNNKSLLIPEANACGNGCATNMNVTFSAGSLDDSYSYH